MKKSFLLIIIFICFSFQSLASIDGKGLYCKLTSIENIKYPYQLHSGYAFSKGKFVHILLKFKNDKYSYGINFQNVYEGFSDVIKLYGSSSFRGAIDSNYLGPDKIIRKTLEVKKTGKIMKMKCEKHESFESLNNKLIKITKTLQKQYDQVIEKNKF